MKTKSALERLALIQKAVDLQAEDAGLWSTRLDGTLTVAEAYLQQALRDLHRVIEDGDLKAFEDIKERSEETKA